MLFEPVCFQMCFDSDTLKWAGLASVAPFRNRAQNRRRVEQYSSEAKPAIDVSFFWRCAITKDVLTNMETGIKELSIGIRQNFDSIESLNGRCQELTEEKDKAPAVYALDTWNIVHTHCNIL